MEQASTRVAMTVYRGVPYGNSRKLMSKNGVIFPYLDNSWKNTFNPKKAILSDESCKTSLRQELKSALEYLKLKKPIIKDPGFTSTSYLVESKACRFGDVVIEVYIPKGTVGAMVLSEVANFNFFKESEVLFNKGASIRYIEGYICSDGSPFLKFKVELVKA